MKNDIYPAIFYTEENGQYSVIFPDLNGISTYGNSLKDAILMAEDLLCMWLLNLKKNKEKINPPSDIRILSTNLDDNSFVTLVKADFDEYKKKYSKSTKKTLTIPLWLNNLAEEQNINFSKVLQEALKDKLCV